MSLWFYANQVTINNGSLVVEVTSGEDVGIISAGDGLIVGSFSPVEIKRAYIDGSNNKFIELALAWDDSNQTSVNARAYYTAGDFIAATKALQDANILINDNFLSLDEWGSSTGSVSFVNQAGETKTARTMLQMDADVQAIQDGNQSIIDTSVSDSIAKIRYGKLDNPLVHLFKKNKLVDTLQGELSWTRDSGATYIDRYGKLQYSPSPYATNLLTYSEDFSNAAWFKSNATALQDSTNHKGKNTAYSVIPSTANARHGVYQEVSVVAGESYTHSTIVKASEINQIRIYSSNTTYLSLRGYFDILNGTSLPESLTGRAKVTPVDNGFYRCEITATAIATGTFFMWVAAALNTTDSYVGNDSDSFIIDSCQFEESRVANGYVKTEATSVSGSSYVGIEVARQEKEGWLFEGDSTNQFPTSSNFISGFSSSVVDIELAPTEDLTNLIAYKAIPNTANGIKSMGQYYTAIAGDTQTFTLIAKAGELGKIQIGSNITQSSNYQLVKVDLALGVIISGDQYVTQFKEIEGGAYILSVTFLTDIGGLNAPTLQVYSNAAEQTWANDGVSGMYFYFAQIEPLPFPSSLIFTYGSPATRAGDIVTIPTDCNVPNVTDEISFSVDVNFIGGGEYQTVFHIGEGTTDVSRLIKWNSDNLRMYFGDSSVRTIVVDQEGRSQVNAVFDGSTGETFNNGVLVTDDSTSKWNTTLPDVIRIGNSDGAFPLFGHISDFRIYDFALNNLEVALLAGE